MSNENLNGQQPLRPGCAAIRGPRERPATRPGRDETHRGHRLLHTRVERDLAAFLGAPLPVLLRLLGWLPENGTDFIFWFI